MSNEEILIKINQLKARVKTIVQNIQALKKQLERAEISLEEFKMNKTLMEDELRGILQHIAQVKETAQVQPLIRARVPPPPSQPIQDKRHIQEEAPPKIEIVPNECVENTSDIIDREIRFASEANELMYYFQTSFIDSITNANVYLSITIEDHFIFGINYTDYPQRPILKIPTTILELYDNDDEKFFDELSTYKYWDTNNPRRIFELVIEIETVLINLYSADLDTILKKSMEFSEHAQNSLEEMIDSTETAIINKNYEKAADLLYAIVDMAYDLQDYDAAKKYTRRLNEVLKKGYKKPKKK